MSSYTGDAQPGGAARVTRLHPLLRQTEPNLLNEADSPKPEPEISKYPPAKANGLSKFSFSAR